MDLNDPRNSGSQPNDGSGDELTQPAVPAARPVPANNQDRRTFLKAAVVASAAVAAVGGAAGAALLSGNNPATLVRFVGDDGHFSVNDPCAICTTATNSDPNQGAVYQPQNAFNGHESVMLWLRYYNVPGGTTYTADAYATSSAIHTASGHTCDSTFPFSYTGDNVTVFTYTPTGAIGGGKLNTNNCSPTADPATLFTTLSGSSSLPVTFTLPGTSSTSYDVLIKVHCKSCSVSGGFSGSLTTKLYVGSGTSGSVLDTCTSYTITEPSS